MVSLAGAECMCDSESNPPADMEGAVPRREDDTFLPKLEDVWRGDGAVVTRVSIRGPGHHNLVHPEIFQEG
jgi:hypothetical protein